MCSIDMNESDLRLGVFLGNYLKESSQVDQTTKNWSLERLPYGSLRLLKSLADEPVQNGRTMSRHQHHHHHLSSLYSCLAILCLCPLVKYI